MDPTQAGLYGIFRWLFDSLFTSQLGFIAVPFLTIIVLLRVVVWSKRTAQGESFEIFTEAQETMQGRIVRSTSRGRGRGGRRSSRRR